MSFQKAETSSSRYADDILIDLMNNPRELKIHNVSELKTSENSKEGYQYFYVSFEDVENSMTFKVPYNVKVNHDDSIYVGIGAKIYPLLSFVSHIEDEAIVCFKEDIDEALNGLVFHAKAVMRKFGRSPYYILIPLNEGDD